MRESDRGYRGRWNFFKNPGKPNNYREDDEGLTIYEERMPKFKPKKHPINKDDPYRQEPKQLTESPLNRIPDLVSKHLSTTFIKPKNDP